MHVWQESKDRTSDTRHSLFYGKTNPSPVSPVDWTIEILLSFMVLQFPALCLQRNQHLFSAYEIPFTPATLSHMFPWNYCALHASSFFECYWLASIDAFTALERNRMWICLVALNLALRLRTIRRHLDPRMRTWTMVLSLSFKF